MTDNFRASLLMIATMAGFSMQDLLIKLASPRVPIGQIIMIIGLVGTAVMFVAAKRKGVNLLEPKLLSRPFLLRLIGEFLGCMLVFKALSLLSMSMTTAIGQAAPVVTTIGAALFLREHVGWRRWSAVAVGLVGVILVLQPGSEGFSPAALLAVLSVIAFAARDLATRVMPPEVNTYHATFWGYVMVLPSAVALMWTDNWAIVSPSSLDWAYILFGASFGVVFYWTLTLALQIGEASVVGPLRYTRIVFALILAIVVLGERPSLLMMLGLSLVVGSGLYTVLREARLRRRRAASLAASGSL